MKRKKCKHKGCKNPVWSGGLCQNHIGRKPLKKYHKMPMVRQFSSKEKAKAIEKLERVYKQKTFFVDIWNKRKHVSEVSGTWLGNEPRTIYFHHILPKSKFKQGEFDEENIILLTWEEHDLVEKDMFKYEEVNKRRERLLKKYNLI